MKLRLVAVFTALSATAGFAADLPLKAPRMVAPAAYSLTGCYVGVHAGYAFDAASTQTSDIIIPVDIGPGGPLLLPTRTITSERASGAVAGGQAGCNYQFSNNVVLGSESEIWYQDVTGTSAPIAIGAPGEFNTGVFKNNLAGATSVRFGYAFDRLLAYGKVGAAFASIQHSSSNAVPGGVPLDYLTVGTNLSVGLLVGGGIEYALTDRVSIKGEYNYIDFGHANHSVVVNSDPGTPIAQTIYGTTNTNNEHEQIFKVGINYRLF